MAKRPTTAYDYIVEGMMLGLVIGNAGLMPPLFLIAWIRDSYGLMAYSLTAGALAWITWIRVYHFHWSLALYIKDRYGN